MKHSQQFIKRRRFLMVLPLLVLPFLTMIFWALGGGQGSPVQAKSMAAGLNFELPDANFHEKEVWDKLKLYEIAQRDSAKFEEARESDPYFDLITFQASQENQSDEVEEIQSNLIDSFPHKDRLTIDANEERVNNKLEQLYREINRPTATQAPAVVEPLSLQTSDPQFSSDVEKLERMMEMMNDNSAADPEMQQMESMLDKILDIQHPERVKEKIKSQTLQIRDHSFPVETSNKSDQVSIMVSANETITESNSGSSVSLRQNGFFGLEDDMTIEKEVGNTIEAIIHDTQELVASATVKMRLLNDIYINGKLIPKDQFIYGVCDINGERLVIEIGSIRTGNFLLPVSLSVYDLDGLEGIYIPGAISRDAAKQASDEAIQNMQLMSLDPSLGVQAASAGIEATKGLLSKKAKLIKVTVKAGYRILLKDTNPNSSTQNTTNNY